MPTRVSSRTNMGAVRGRRRSRAQRRPVRSVAASGPNLSTVEGVMGKRVRQAKRTAAKVARVTGSVITTAQKRIKRAAARQRLKQKMRKAGRALKEVGRAAVVAGLAAGAVRGAQLFTRRG